MIWPNEICLPLYPAGHRHSYPRVPGLSIHVPPCRQGLVWQESSSCWQSFPVYPVGQLHTKSFNLSVPVHTPSFIQGLERQWSFKLHVLLWNPVKKQKDNPNTCTILYNLSAFIIYSSDITIIHCEQNIMHIHITSI